MVEDDLMHINQSMKTAREARQDETLSTLIVQKELAEREVGDHDLIFKCIRQVYVFLFIPICLVWFT